MGGFWKNLEKIFLGASDGRRHSTRVPVGILAHWTLGEDTHCNVLNTLHRHVWSSLFSAFLLREREVLSVEEIKFRI